MMSPVRLTSAYVEFPRSLAEQVRRDFPALWRRHGTGGNPPTRWTGDDAFRVWGWSLLLRGGTNPPRSEVAAARSAFAKLTGAPWVGPDNALFLTVVELWWKKR